MSKFRMDAALLSVALAAALAFRLSSGSFDWLSSVAGVCLLLVLFAFDVEGYRSVFQSLAFSAIAAFCVTIAAQLPYDLLAANPDPKQAQIRLTLTWGFATVVFWAIDRARMSGRVETPQESSARPILGRTLTPAPLATPPAQPMYQTPPPPAPAPVYEPASVPAPVYEPPPAAAPVYEPAPAPAVYEETTQLPAIAPIPAGKEAMVYVSLVGEGIPCLRSVRAEHLGRDFYRIAEPMPEGETWEYQPGQVVRAKKKNLSSGKALVAFEEAPRA